MHTLLGGGGNVGRSLAQALHADGAPVRIVGRAPRALGPSDEVVAADLLDAAATDRAVAGSRVVYLLAGLPYRTSVWQDRWPRVMDHIVGACVRHGARLVFYDNVYAYGRAAGPMTEETPFNPCSRKGEVRARIATTLLDAMRAGEVEALIARSADFYGPDVSNSFLGITVLDRLRAGKGPQWLGPADAVHTFSYVPDQGPALARLAQSDAAVGQTWHLPTTSEALTPREIAALACRLAGRDPSFQVLPAWVRRALGLILPDLRESEEMLYQFEMDYRLDSSKLERAFGLRPTLYADGLRASLGLPPAA